MKEKGRFRDFGIQFKLYGLEHMVNPPQDFVELEFLDSSGHRSFLEQYCNHEVYSTIKIIELGALIDNSLQNI